MRQLLTPHPDSRCLAAARIEVEVARPSANSLALSYIVTGPMNDVRVPPVTAAERGEKLWQHTCFEAFVRASGAEYYEFNFAPSTQWAAYRFGGYRSGMCIAEEINAFAIEVQSAPDRYTLRTALDLDRLSVLPHSAVWRLGLSAVIEHTSGVKSYWALAHPPGTPDFHHVDGFAHEFSRVAPL
jgi:hypothetical protein